MASKSTVASGAVSLVVSGRSRSGVSASFPLVVALLLGVLFSLPLPAQAQNVTSGTTIYGTGQSGTNWVGGTISPGAMLRLDNGATVTGPVVDNGTLQFNQTGLLTISSTIQGTGTLSLTNTGTLNLTGMGVAGTVVLDMTTSVSSGALQINSGNTSLQVGRSGTGTLNVTGGNVSSNFSTLGVNAGGVGEATVSSGTWASINNLTVGSSGTGTLNVFGGYVSNNAGYLGTNAGGVGTATVSSGTWANRGDLTVGSSGTGTLTINGGLVSVSGTLSKGTYGTINLNSGGTLQVGTGSTGGVLLGGTGSLANNGTLIFNRSDDSTYSGVLSGSGAVKKLGGGT